MLLVIVLEFLLESLFQFFFVFVLVLFLLQVLSLENPKIIMAHNLGSFAAPSSILYA